MQPAKGRSKTYPPVEHVRLPPPALPLPALGYKPADFTQNIWRVIQ